MGRCIRVIALLAGLGLGGSARADENLQIVIRTGADITKDNVIEAFVNALKTVGAKPPGHGDKIIQDKQGNDGGTIKDKVIVRDITANDYNSYRRLEDPDAVLAPLPSQKKDDLEVRQLPAANPTWEFNLLGTTPKELTKLEVTYADAPDKPVALEPTKKRGDALTLTQFGSYVLTPPAGKKPLKYKATIREIGVDRDTPVEGEWPKSDNFFLIRLNGYKGDKKDLEETIRDPKQIGGTALDSFSIKKDVTLAIGEAGATDDEQEEDSFDGNKIYISIPPNRRDNAARVYMRFPLSKDQMDAELKELNKMTPNKLADYVRGQMPIPAAQDFVITPDTKATWLELPKVERKPGVGGPRIGTFGRTLSLANADGNAVKPDDYQKLREKFPQAYKIVVYEFDNGTIQNAIYYKRSPEQKERTLANGGPLTTWSVQLAARVKPAGDAPKDDKPKDDKPKDEPKDK